jgi:hypothetical protein
MRTIFLGTTAVMGAAHRFYERHGFVSIDPRELPASFLRMDVDTRFYRRHLNTVHRFRSMLPRQRLTIL